MSLSHRIFQVGSSCKGGRAEKGCASLICHRMTRGQAQEEGRDANFPNELSDRGLRGGLRRGSGQPGKCGDWVGRGI